MGGGACLDHGGGGIHLDHSAGRCLVSGSALGSGGSGVGTGTRSRLGAHTDCGAAGTGGLAHGHIGCHVPVKAKAAAMAFLLSLFKQNFGTGEDLT